MTQVQYQFDLEHLSETQLHLKLRQMFNSLTGLPQASRECQETIAAVENIKRALRSKLNRPQP